LEDVPLTTEQSNPISTHLITGRRALWGRRLAVATAILFGVSSAVLAVARFVRDRETWPKWWGVLDVIFAFLLAILAIAGLGIAEGKVTKQAQDASYRAYRILTHGILALLVVFFLAGDRIVWSNCLTGFAWRAWLLLYGLPAWFTVFSGGLDIQVIRPRQAVAASR
jgi:hypothetical protein